MAASDSRQTCAEPFPTKLLSHVAARLPNPLQQLCDSCDGLSCLKRPVQKCEIAQLLAHCGDTAVLVMRIEEALQAAVDEWNTSAGGSPGLETLRSGLASAG